MRAVTQPFIHPATPPRLVKRFKALGYKYHRLADELSINVAHVYNLINKGKEPKDKDIRRALFLPSRKRSPGAKTNPHIWLPGEKKMTVRINRAAKETRKAVLR
jgi:hypothetical protein